MDAVCDGCQPGEQKSDMWELFLGKTDWFKATRSRIGSFDLTEKPCQAFPFLLVNIVGDIHRNCIIQYGSCFMKRQMGKAKGKASQSVPLLRAPQNVIKYIFRKLEICVFIWKQCITVLFGHFKEDRKRFQPNICKSFQPDTNSSADSSCDVHVHVMCTAYPTILRKLFIVWNKFHINLCYKLCNRPCFCCFLQPLLRTLREQTRSSEEIKFHF